MHLSAIVTSIQGQAWEVDRVTDEKRNLVSGELLDDGLISLAELCRVCGLRAERVIELADAGVIEPRGSEQERWQFHSVSVVRIQRAVRMERDLGVNPAGVALALDLLDELETLRARMKRLADAAQ